MRSRKLTSPDKFPQRPPAYNCELLRESVHESIKWAQQQVERSRQLVAHSQEIIARIKRSLACAARIQHGSGGEPMESENFLSPHQNSKTGGG